jgi:two-component system OmpR family response regulator
MRILVVEDEHRIAQAIKEGLEQESYAVDVCFDGEEGYNSAANDEYDIILLDVMMPGMNGYEVCRKLREEGNHTPILMLTAKDQPRDVVEGLDTGADDYLAKPFAFEVLLARIRALLRRPSDTIGETLQAGDLELNPTNHEVTRDGVLSKNNIMTHVWDFDADILPNNVEVFITYLRAKVDKPFQGPNLIQTVRGFGYKIEA